MGAGCRTHRFWASLAVAGFSILLFLNSIPGEFVFDDHEAIENNIDVRLDTPLSDVFSNDFWGLPLNDPESHKSYRPLTVLSFRLNRHFHGLWAPGFHVGNIAAHSLVCVLFFWFCFSLGLGLLGSLGTALLFVAHPIHTEAVTSIVGRTEILSALFFLLSVMAYQRSLITRQCKSPAGVQRPERFSVLWMALVVLLSAISLLCKEQGVTALGVCLSYDVFVVCGINFHSFAVTLRYILQGFTGKENIARASPPPKWLLSLIKRTILISTTAIGLLVLRIVIIGGGSPTFVDSDNPASFSPHVPTRLLTHSYLCAFNFWLLLCPSWLCYDWSMGSIPLIESLGDGRNFATCGVIILLVVVALYGLAGGYSRPTVLQNGCTITPAADINNCIATVTSNGWKQSTNSHFTHRRKKTDGSHNSSTVDEASNHLQRTRRLTLFALSLLLLPFLPASNLFFPVGFVVAERVLYLPSMGFCVLVALGYKSVCHHGIISQRRKWKLFATLTFCCIFLAFSTKTLARNLEWANTQSLAESALKVNPGNAKVHLSMGNVLAQKGTAGRAVETGNAFKGNRSCEAFYREALRLRPQYTAAWANLGLVLVNTDRPQEAEDCYRRALSIKPDHVNGNTNMAHLCRIQERWEEACQHYSIAVKRRPKNPVLHYFIGFVSEKLGAPDDLQKAELEFRNAIQLHPAYWEAHLALGRLLATTSNGRRLQYGYTSRQQTDKAILHYEKAIQLKPDNTDARYELGKLLLSKGSAKRAEEELLAAVKLSPSHAPAHLELGNTYEALGNIQHAVTSLQKAVQLDQSLSVARQKLNSLIID